MKRGNEDVNGTARIDFKMTSKRLFGFYERCMNDMTMGQVSLQPKITLDIPGWASSDVLSARASGAQGADVRDEYRTKTLLIGTLLKTIKKICDVPSLDVDGDDLEID